VIATELHEARRIDRQLFGRCGRQGDPGTYQAIISLEDELVRIYARRWWQKFNGQIIVDHAARSVEPLNGISNGDERTLRDILISGRVHTLPAKWRRSLTSLGGVHAWTRAATIRLAQRGAERLHSRMRRNLLKSDEQQEAALAFSGRSE